MENNNIVPSYIELLENLEDISLMELRKGNTRASLDANLKCITINPSLERLYFLNFVFHHNNGNYNRAVELIERTIVLNNENPNYWFYRGIVYSHFQGENYISLVIESFNKAISLNPENPEYYICLGEFLFNIAEYPLAKEYLNKAISLNGPSLSPGIVQKIKSIIRYINGILDKSLILQNPSLLYN